MSIEEFEEIMNLQRKMASRVVEENELDLQLKLLDIVNSLVKDKNKQVSIAQIVAVAAIEGISEDETTRLLNVLENMGHLRQISRGFYKRA